MNYLQNIRVLLGEEKFAEKFDLLTEKLARRGIVLKKSVGKFLWDDIAAKITAGEKGLLFVTDTAEIAGKLAESGLLVMAFLHEKNSGQNFAKIKYAMERPEELDADYFERVYRRLAGLPCDVLETERCFVRETTVDDVEAFFEIYHNPQITRYTEGLYPKIAQEKEYVREYIEKIYGFYDFGVWTIVEKATGDIIGRAGLSYRAEFEEPEIGFVIGVPWQRKGYAFEVCSAILKFAKEELGFTEVNAMVRPENKASLGLCRRLGFAEKDVVNISGDDGESLPHLWLAVKLSM